MAAQKAKEVKGADYQPMEVDAPKPEEPKPLETLKEVIAKEYDAQSNVDNFATEIALPGALTDDDEVMQELAFVPGEKVGVLNAGEEELLLDPHYNPDTEDQEAINAELERSLNPPQDQ